MPWSACSASSGCGPGLVPEQGARHLFPCSPPFRGEQEPGTGTVLGIGEKSETCSGTGATSLPWLPFVQVDSSPRGLGLAVRILSELGRVRP
jgi:hypothetical protein